MQIPGYQVLGPLGSGGQASVFRARSQAGEDVALKLFPPAKNATQVGRFRREADAMRAIAHPGVVKVLDHGVIDEHPYMVLELIKGHSLSAAIQRGLSLERALDVGEQLAAALAAVHAAGVAHRDVKPENVLLAGERVVLVDFGLAHLDSLGAHSLTQSGALLGTPTYMAPELAMGNFRAVGPTSDVYSWAVTLFEAVCGRPPFTSDSLVGLLRTIAEDPAPSLRSFAGQAPPWLASLIARCMAKAPEARPRDGAALLRAFREARGGTRSASPRALYAALAALALGLGAGVWALSGGGDNPPAPPDERERAEVAPPSGRQLVELRLDPLRGQDTYVNSWGLYTNDNYGAERSLTLGMRASKGGLATRQVYLRFPLERIPKGAEVEHASLELTEPGVARQTFTIVAHRVLEPWVEGANGLDDSLDGVAWGDGPQPLVDASFARPAHEEQPLSSFTRSTPRETPRWDVTEAVRGWLADPASNHGVVLRPLRPDAEIPPGSGRFHAFRSRDAKLERERPCLRVSYRGAPPRPLPPFSERWERHRRETEVALEAIRRESPAEQLSRIGALLVATPSDVTLRCARVDAMLGLGELEPAIHECQALFRVGTKPYPPVAAEAAARVLDTPGFVEAVNYDKPWIAWESYWRLLDPANAPAEPKPARAFRVAHLQRRIAFYGRFDKIVAHYELGLTHWPGNFGLSLEQRSLGRVALEVARAMAKKPQTLKRAQEIAREALKYFECTAEQRLELERLAR